MSADTPAVAVRFMADMQAFERGADVGPLAELFADDAELSNLSHAEAGRGGARRFWEAYRAAFGTVRSEFTAVTVGDGRAALEWVSAGTFPSGEPIRYRGVSILEVEGDRVHRFRAYCDSAAFVVPASPPGAGGDVE